MSDAALPPKSGGSIDENEPARNELVERDEKGPRPVSPERVRREALRWTLGLQVFVVAASMAATFAANSTWAHMDAFLGHTYTGLVGITGTVLGYYFGRGGQE